ncbi:S-adenosyl-L-methionine-dependent methyltransferase [Calocera viscosa TUFC12733]|uniref:S-adenosyl-L-methionine-dependent methyltransferase n=1 Tax=Calocera viscosa (strain TUFC12733) TaxID=1330018 RepID=A0A167JTV7_CALVF|nr:S-adenosyl-L-methionine-dependent methyltransferase [Calocera viscosa TUFC12733]
MAARVLQLAKLISDSAATIDKACTENGTSVPDLDAPFDPRGEMFRSHAGVSVAVNTAISAANQLLATLRPAPSSILQTSSGFVHSTSLRVAFEANVSTIIKEAGGDGLHVDEIAAKAKIDPKKLVRILRFLATHHVFLETQPDVFANNRLSSLLDIGKPLSELHSVNKFEGTSGLQALLARILDESAKARSYTWETLHDPKSAFSEEPGDSPFCTFIGKREPYWDWLEEPEQAPQLAALGVGMGVMDSMLAGGAILKGFDFKSLTENDLIVDVGGGVGNAVLPIAQANPSVRIIVQDRAAVIEDGIQHWKQKLPAALDSGRVTFQPSDFFAPQSVKGPSVFFVRHILHNWSDKYVGQILSNLRAAASPHTKLLIMDSIMHYVCRDPAGEEGTVPGWESMRNDAPPPLLPNWGMAGAQTYASDLQMMAMHNAQERTLLHLSKLLKGAGWRLIRVHPDPSHLNPQVEAVPI